MPVLDEIKPTKPNRIYDMVREVGVDVSDWEHSKGAARSAASNPKYCYNWSIVEPGRVVVLNLWHSDMKERDGSVSHTFNIRALAERSKGVVVSRARNMDSAIQEARHDNLPIRVVVCEGRKRNKNNPTSNASKVSHRLLDPEPWHVSSYDQATGQCTLTRGLGGGADAYIDQFSIPPDQGGPAQRIQVSGSVFIRRPEVRKRALYRARGKCEFCDALGFLMANGKIYLETHHVVPLHENGEDSVNNVVALCPNHHREAHHGERKADMRRLLLSKLVGMAPNNSLQRTSPLPRRRV